MFAEFIQFSSSILSIEEFLTGILLWLAGLGWLAGCWLAGAGRLGLAGWLFVLAGWLAGLLACRLGI